VYAYLYHFIGILNIKLKKTALLIA